MKLQEELKSARSATKSLEETLQREKERGKAREQEAFTARYQIVGVQEQLEKAHERIKVVEQERDAFKTAAKNEEVARIAAEGRLPLPPSHDPTDEFSSPKKKTVPAKRPSGRSSSSRVSLSTMEIMSSAASEMEIEDLNTQLLWERQRADRAQEMIEFLQAECQMRCCPCSKTKSSNARKSLEAPQKRRRVSVEQEEEQQPVIVKEEPHSPHSQRAVSRSSQHSSSHRTSLRNSIRLEKPQEVHELEPEIEAEPETVVEPEPQRIKSRKEPRRSTIFCPKEGIFRTVSEQEAAAMEAQNQCIVAAEPAIEEEVHADEPLPSTEEVHSPRMYARTPSVDPPAFALLAQERDSLDSLLNAPHDDAQSAPLPPIPSVPVVADEEVVQENVRVVDESFSPAGSPDLRPHTSTASYTVTTTVPLREDTARSSSSFNERLRTPSHGSSASFDSNDPAMTPTMTREQALAKIRERRGRARSAAQGGSGPGKKVAAVTSGPRGRPVKRDVSAPTAKATPRFKS